MRTLGLILLGASVFDHRPDLNNPRFAASAKAIEALFTKEQILPDTDTRVLDLFDRTYFAPQLVSQIGEFAIRHPAIDDVIIYYCGHGFVPPRKRYSAFLRVSDEKQITSLLQVKDFLSDVRDKFPDRRMMVMLDACFSGEIIREYNEEQDVLAAGEIIDQELASLPRRGFAIITASDRHQVARALEEDQLTLFTGSLIDIVRQGIAGTNRRLSWQEIRDAVAKAMRTRKPDRAPTPRLYTDEREGDITKIPYFPNPAFRPLPPGFDEHAVDEKTFELYFWKYIEARPDPILFEEFLRRFPRGIYATLARTTLRELLNKATQEVAEDFLSATDIPEHAALARARLATLEAPKLVNVTDPIQLRAFIHRYKDTTSAAQIVQELAKLLWTSLCYSDDVQALSEFAEEFKTTKEGREAEQRVRSLETALAAEATEWERIKASQDPRDFQRFLKPHPNGRFAAEARSRLAQLLEESVRKLSAEPSLVDVATALRFYRRVAVCLGLAAIPLIAAAGRLFQWLNWHWPQQRPGDTGFMVGSFLVIAAAVMLTARRRRVVSGIEIAFYWLALCGATILGLASLSATAEWHVLHAVGNASGLFLGALMTFASAGCLVARRREMLEPGEVTIYWAGCALALLFCIPSIAIALDFGWERTNLYENSRAVWSVLTLLAAAPIVMRRWSSSLAGWERAIYWSIGSAAVLVLSAFVSPAAGKAAIIILSCCAAIFLCRAILNFHNRAAGTIFAQPRAPWPRGK